MHRAIALLLLSALGTGCAYAAIGVALFARLPDAAVFGWVFFAFGGAAGLCCTVLRLGRIELSAQAAAAAQRLPQAAPAAATAPVDAAAPAWTPPGRLSTHAAAASASTPAPATRQPEPRTLTAAGFASSAFGAL